jgi:hypothetical protein
MAVPDFHSLLIPSLRTAADGGKHSLAKEVRWGAGLDPDPFVPSLRAIVTAVNRA